MDDGLVDAVAMVRKREAELIVLRALAASPFAKPEIMVHCAQALERYVAAQRALAERREQSSNPLDRV